jgi:hypothetical protein
MFAWTARLAALVALAAICVGCAAQTPVAVTYDPRDDIARYASWDWIEGRAVVVRAPAHDAAALEQRLSAQLASELGARGLARSPGHAEIRVAALLVARRTLLAYRRGSAMQTVNSFHHTGNYELQADVTELREVDRCRLIVFVTDPVQKKLLWQGQLDDQYADGVAENLDAAVARVLEAYPTRSASAAPIPASAE